MGAGYLASAVAIFARRVEADALIALHAIGLVGAYGVTRSSLPIEPIGVTTKAAEVGVALIAGALFLRKAR